MACLLTTGRKVPCKSAVGGLRSIAFADYGTLGSYTINVDGSIDLDASTVWYEFEIKGNSSLDTTINSSRENGTTFYQSALTMELTYQDLATQEEIKLLSAARPHIVVRDYNDNYFLLGLEHGCELTTGNIVTGAAMADKTGYTLNFEAMETQPPLFIGDIATYIDQVSGTQIDPTA